MNRKVRVVVEILDNIQGSMQFMKQLDEKICLGRFGILIFKVREGVRVLLMMSIYCTVYFFLLISSYLTPN